MCVLLGLELLNSSSIPQTKQHEPEGWRLSCMGGIQLIYWMLRLTTHCHICYRLHPFHFVLFKDLVAKQQTYAHAFLRRSSKSTKDRSRYCSICRMQLICWMLSLATHCHILYRDWWSPTMLCAMWDVAWPRLQLPAEIGHAWDTVGLLSTRVRVWDGTEMRETW